jgi:hypothetical protein
MLRHPTLTTLETLKLTVLATALAEELEMPDVQRLSFEERLGLLVDRECTVRDNYRLARRLAQARFPGSATLKDLDYRHPRRLDKSVIVSLATGQWIRQHANVLIVGLLDDWGLAPLTDEHGRDLLELLDDRHGRRATPGGQSTRRSGSRRWLMLFLTVSCTTPIRSRSKENRCANG